MQKRLVSVIAFIAVIAASFYLGTFVNQSTDPSETDVNATFLEILGQIENNHFSQPESDVLWQGAIDGLIASIDDPYTSYFDFDEYVSYQGGFDEDYVGIGVTVQYQDERIVIEEVKSNSPAENAGILPNDVLVEVNGNDITSTPYYEVIQQVLGEEGTDVTIGVQRQGFEDIIQFTMTRAIIENSTVTYTTYTEGDKTIGYIEVTKFGDQTAGLFEDALQSLETDGVDGMIIDMRNNPGGHLNTVVSMLQLLLVDDGREMFSVEYYSNGTFIRDEFFGALPEKKSYDIVTLINENSASAAEVFSSAMKEHGGYEVVGTTSFGKGTMQTDVPLASKENDSLHLTIGKWLTANLNWVHYDGGTGGVEPTISQELLPIEIAYKLFLSPNETLLYDTVDSRVENVQIILNAMGYPVRTDGYFDQETKDAIIDIQTTNDMVPTGDVDAEVLVVINQFLTDYRANYQNDTQLEVALQYFNE